MEIYFDNSATTKPYKEVIDFIVSDLSTNYGNPSSIHRLGIEAEKLLKKSRLIISEALHCSPKEIIFTSGGTESNNLAIKGLLNSRNSKGKHIVTSSIEHDSIYTIFMELKDKHGFEVSFVSPDEDGYISVEKVEKELREDTILVSIMHVNNELGTINPIKEIGELIKKKSNKISFHVDAVQSFLKLELNPKALNIDLLSVSSHKIHGPKGAGALYIRDSLSIAPLFTGGGQESNLRSGTENTTSINGFAKAVELQKDSINKNYDIIENLKTYFRNQIEKSIDNIKINTPKNSSSHILNISFLGVKGEILLHSLEQDGIYVSTGSACSSKKKGSRVLEKIKLNNVEKEGAIRFSFSTFNTKEEIDYTVEKLISHVTQLRKILKYKP